MVQRAIFWGAMVSLLATLVPRLVFIQTAHGADIVSPAATTAT